MASQERQALLDKANELGLEFAGNISNAKLQEMVDEASGPAIKEGESNLVADNPEQAPAPAAADESTPAPAPAVTGGSTPKRPLTREQRMRQFAAEAKRKALKKRIVTITNKDNRDNDVTTTAMLSIENQYFAIGRIVPLDVPVELEQALIDCAEASTIILHKDEIVNGKRTGNKVAVPTKRYVVSYSETQPEG